MSDRCATKHLSAVGRVGGCISDAHKTLASGAVPSAGHFCDKRLCTRKNIHKKSPRQVLDNSQAIRERCSLVIDTVSPTGAVLVCIVVPKAFDPSFGPCCAFTTSHFNSLSASASEVHAAENEKCETAPTAFYDCSCLLLELNRRICYSVNCGSTQYGCN